MNDHQLSCATCGAAFVAPKWEKRRGRRFCSAKCHHDFPRWKDRRANFDSYYIPEPNSGCWLWLGSIMNMGYGTINIRGKNYLAHRISFEIATGNLPSDRNVCHRCDNPICVNPDHLFLGTQLDNMRDMAAKGRGGNGGNRGSDHPQAKIGDADAIAIRNDGRPVRLIGREYGISRTQVSSIKTGKSWRHV